MTARTCPIVLLPLLAFNVASPTYGQQSDQSGANREPGVRIQLFQLGAPQDRIRELVPGQSPNLDRTIARLRLDGDELFLGDQPPPYLAVLSAILEIKLPGRYRFQLSCDALASLRVNGEQIVLVDDGRRAVIDAVELRAGPCPIEVTLVANDDEPNLRVRWGQHRRTLEPIPANSLTAEAFVFRPTNPGKKRLVGETTRPGLRQKVAGLYPGLELATIRPPGVDVPVGGLATLADGALVVAVFNAQSLRAPSPRPEPNGELWLYHRPDGDPRAMRREMIADGLFEPAGVCVVDDAIYLSQRSEVTRFDHDPELGEWTATTVASGWETNDFHAISFGLVHEPGREGHPGYLYMAKGTGLGLKRNPPNHGSVWRIDLSLPEGRNVQPITGGHRTPNGLGWGPEGTLLVTDNQGEYTPANELNVVREGGFYGFYHETTGRASPSPFQPKRPEPGNRALVAEAAVWLPQDEIGNSPTQPLLIPEGWLFGGQVLVGDMRYGGIVRVSLDKVGGAWQGAAYRFTQGLEGGVNRLAFGADGSLYVGGIGGEHASTWAWVNPQGRRTHQGLQRLNPNGRETFDLQRVSPKPGGFEVRWTKEIDAGWLGDPSNYHLRQWTYRATPEYGGPKRELEDLRVSSATPTPDGKGARLQVDGLKRDRVVRLLMDPASTQGEEVWSAEAWYTLRAMPGQ